MHAAILTLILTAPGAEANSAAYKPVQQNGVIASSCGADCGGCDVCADHGRGHGLLGGRRRGRAGHCAAMPQTCYSPRYGCYPGNSRDIQRYPAFHGSYYRRAYNYRRYFEYPWHASLHEPTSYFSYNVPPQGSSVVEPGPTDIAPPPPPGAHRHDSASPRLSIRDAAPRTDIIRDQPSARRPIEISPPITAPNPIGERSIRVLPQPKLAPPPAEVLAIEQPESAKIPQKESTTLQEEVKVTPAEKPALSAPSIVKDQPAKKIAKGDSKSNVAKSSRRTPSAAAPKTTPAAKKVAALSSRRAAKRTTDEKEKDSVVKTSITTTQTEDGFTVISDQ